MFPRTATIRSHKSSAVIPSNLNPASKEMISHSVELCETEVCFLHIQLIGTIVYGFRKRIMFSQKRMLSPQDLLQIRSLETVPACIALQYYPHNNTVCFHMCDECKISIDSGVCHRLLVHFVNDRANLFTDHRISDLRAY